MKRFLGVLAILLGLPIQSYAQKAIVYTTPQGNRIYYTAANATVDSVWDYLLTNNTVAGAQVYTAVLLTARRTADLANGPYTNQVNFSRPASVLDPYKVAAVVANTTVSGGLVNISPLLKTFLYGMSTGTKWSSLFDGASALSLAGNSSATGALFSVTDTLPGAYGSPTVIGRTGTLKNLFILENSAPTGKNDTVILYRNGVATTIKPIFVNGSLWGVDSTHTVTVTPFDRFSLGGTAGSSDNGTAAVWFIEFDLQ